MDRGDHLVHVVRVVSLPGNHDLPAVAQALNTLRFLFGFGQARQEHGRQDGYDRNDDQEFD